MPGDQPEGRAGVTFDRDPFPVERVEDHLDGELVRHANICSHKVDREGASR